MASFDLRAARIQIQNLCPDTELIEHLDAFLHVIRRRMHFFKCGEAEFAEKFVALIVDYSAAKRTHVDVTAEPHIHAVDTANKRHSAFHRCRRTRCPQIRRLGEMRIADFKALRNRTRAKHIGDGLDHAATALHTFNSPVSLGIVFFRRISHRSIPTNLLLTPAAGVFEIVGFHVTGGAQTPFENAPGAFF
ncbi:MAG: hypothetical protein ABW049_14600, partial [Spongiibacteraceae bacterium]